MIWACFNFFGKSKISFIDGSIDSIKYQEVLSTTLLPFIEEQNLQTVIFQQDNARPHVSASTKSYLRGKGIEVMS